MAKLYNLARMTTTTTGTGTITLGSAVAGYLTFAQAGVANGDVVDYAIKDGNDSEIGTGTYTSSGTTLTRTVTKSTNSNAAISLSGAAEVFITPRAETLNDASLLTTGTVGTARLPLADNAQMVWDTSGGTLKIDPRPTLSGVALPAGTDFNTVLSGGTYAVAGGGTNANAPGGLAGNYFYLEVIAWSASHVYQRASLVDGFRATYDRVNIGGTWVPWQRLDNRVLLNTLTASGASSIQDTTSITSQFYKYEIDLINFTVSNSGAGLFLQAYIGGAFQTSNQSTGVFAYSTVEGATAAGTGLNLGDTMSNNSTYGINGMVEFIDPLNTNFVKPLYCRTAYMRNNGSIQQMDTSTVYVGSTAAMTGFRIVPTAGTFSGVAKLYGIPA